MSEKEILQALRDMDKKHDSTNIAVHKLTKHVLRMPCKVHDEQIGTMKKLVYGFVGFVLFSWLIGIGDTPIKAVETFKQFTQRNEVNK